ncbi:MAG: hypothetical protein AB8I08_13235 [Sandaracinaceae bacterium]
MRHRFELGFVVVLGLTAWGCAMSFTRPAPEADIVDDQPRVMPSDGAGVDAAVSEDAALSEDAAAADAGIGAPAPLPAVPPHRAAWVTDTRHDRVMVIDLESELLVAEVAVGGMPRPIAASPDGRTVYVGNNADGTISVVDVARREVVRTIALQGRAANAMAVHPSGATLYTATTAGLLEVELAAGTIGRTLSGFGPSAGIAVSPDGTTIFAATDFNSRSLAMIDVSGFFVRHTLSGFTGIARVRFGPDGDLYVADERAGAVVVVGGPFGDVIRRIPVPGAPFAVAVTEDVQALVIGHDQDAPQRMDLVQIDGEGAHDVSDVPAGAGAVPSVQMGADGVAYAAGFLTGEVFVLDTRSSRVRARIATAGAPFDLVLVP